MEEKYFVKNSEKAEHSKEEDENPLDAAVNILRQESNFPFPLFNYPLTLLSLM